MKNLFFAAAMLVAVAAQSQTFIPMREGTVLEYSYTDAKGRELKNEWRERRWLRLTVEKTWGDTVANIAIESDALDFLAKMKILPPRFRA